MAGTRSKQSPSANGEDFAPTVASFQLKGISIVSRG